MAVDGGGEKVMAEGISTPSGPASKPVAATWGHSAPQAHAAMPGEMFGCQDVGDRDVTGF